MSEAAATAFLDSAMRVLLFLLTLSIAASMALRELWDDEQALLALALVLATGVVAWAVFFN